jgi:hypothetical protein
MIFLALAIASCTTPIHTGIIIPYRNRDYHASVLVPHLVAYRRAHFPCDFFHIWLVEQDDMQPFNRGWLGNVGITLALNSSIQYDCIVFHDVDLKPAEGVPYTACDMPVQLSSELEHFNWGIPYKTFTGAVVSMKPQHWVAINGFSNDYIGWGGEDDDLHFRLRAAKLLSGTAIHRNPHGTGKFYTIDETTANHPRDRSGTYKTSLRILGQMKAGSDRWKTDGLSSTTFTVSKQTHKSRIIVKVSVRAAASTDKRYQ